MFFHASKICKCVQLLPIFSCVTRPKSLGRRFGTPSAAGRKFVPAKRIPEDWEEILALVPPPPPPPATGPSVLLFGMFAGSGAGFQWL